MKDKLKYTAVGVVLGAMLTAAIGVSAAGGQQIEVYFKPLKFMFDGKEKKPAEGQPFIYEGTTYVPLRFMSETLGKQVQYDGKNDTIWVGNRYTQAPKMAIDVNKTYTATIETNKGPIVIELFAKDAPQTVNNFIALARDGFYDDVVFHRIIQSFMIQTGDPAGTGRGGPGYSFADELGGGHKYEPGIVAMANAGPDTNGSQFFICTGPDSEYLNSTPNYTIFGKVSSGMDTVQAIAATPVKATDRGEASVPVETVKMLSVQIAEK
ncbi:Peptidyl-prolyl cis-trans isomerase (rotamase)-cyclophilin family [Paenibacillus sp. UNCCL117]|uniref:peptidylprolyl isomerase n=1 Tax=unclassified Paenibacillus TaxID=185978 RepID=UPI00088688D0|nr:MULTISPECIES: peptidylprolyl isomerase [unclassified Paenibacillus]SDE23328.1 Peptidyl-prolyl cis-trans isomerase (rotamase)-cyclophilin family [Paenibacillus sp. cl123]SFW42645.1 Peptidyl-prolyl cis-trans isomerase (rotamase)-cyclophilin family [Paenibacillus sp. UNCCL117]